MNFYTNVIQWGSNLLLREVVNGERRSRRVKYSPTLYCPVNKQTGYKTLTGVNVTPVTFDSIPDAKEWVEGYKDQPHLIYGNTDYKYSFLNETYGKDFDMDDIYVCTIDIEVECANGFPNADVAEEPMLSITVKNHQSKQILVWGMRPYKTTRDDVTYILCQTEEELLGEFVKFWSLNPPDILTGWNTEFFDIPYVCNRIKKLLGEDVLKKLSPWNSVQERKVFKNGRHQMTFDIAGVAALDYLDLFRKFTYNTLGNQERYTLDHIAWVVLGEKKDANPYDLFSEWYEKDYQSFIDYNITDVELVDKLEDKLQLIELCLTMAYDAKVNYTDVLGTVKYWDVLIHNYLMDRKYVIPQKTHQEKSEKYEGAYVKDPQIGEHKWVLSFDLNSLYPHLIMQYNISPEMMLADKTVPNMSVDKLLNKSVDTSILRGVTLTPNGALFKTTEKGFLPEILESIYNDRVVYKRKMIDAQKEYEKSKDPKLLKEISRYSTIQMAKKISINSAYGAIGNQWFRYYNNTMAEAITTSGQLSIKWIEKKLNEYLNNILKTENEDYVVYGDTDSVYITFEKLVGKLFPEGTDSTKIVDFLNSVATDKIEPFIEESYKELADYLNAYDQKMFMKRETIADKGIWTAKKRYILNAWDVEGVRYDKPKLKITGIEAVKSSTPTACRDKIKEALAIIMNGDVKELNDFIQQFRKEFMNLSPDEIAYPRSCNGVGKWSDPASLYKKGTPIHVKGAILYNHLVKKEGLGGKYPYIQEGDKIKFMYLTTPNVFQSSSIAFITDLPVELNFNVDYDLQFEKSFIEPLSIILDSIKWSIDRSYGTQGSLEDFWS